MDNNYALLSEQENQRLIDECYAGLAEYEDRNYRRRQMLYKAIRKVLGLKFFICFKYILEEDNCTIHSFCFVSKPRGEAQRQDRGIIKKYWVRQRSVGMEGDSFEGEITFQLKQNMYVEFSYSC